MADSGAGPGPRAAGRAMCARVLDPQPVGTLACAMLLPGPVRIPSRVLASLFLALASVAASEAGTVHHVSRTDPACGGRIPCYGTIQAAVNVAQAGDRVLIQPGTYVEQVSVAGKNAGVITPAGRILITERPGRLRIVDKGKLLPAVTGTPKVWERQDAGLFDVEVHPQYGKTGWIYLSYSEPLPGYTPPPPDAALPAACA